MNDMIPLVFGFGCGALAGGGFIFYTAGVAVEELKRQKRVGMELAEDWHRHWANVNNTLDEVRTACKAIKVPTRGKNGKIVGSSSVWKVIQEARKNV